MSKLKLGGLDLKHEDLDLKHVFNRTFQENHLDLLCNADEIVVYEPKKMNHQNTEFHEESNNFLEMKDGSFLKASYTLAQGETYFNPFTQHFFQKSESSLTFQERAADWDFNISKNQRYLSEYDNAKTFIEYPISAMWQGGNKNQSLKDFDENQDIIKVTSQMSPQNSEKKFRKNETFNSQENRNEFQENKREYGIKIEETIEKIQKKNKKPNSGYPKRESDFFETPLKKRLVSKGNGTEDTPGRSARGLRILSIKVKEIVCRMEKATYKEVAEALVQDLDLNRDENSKDEQNIKRRVYDALNVLIASNILRKKGKHVFSEECCSYSGTNIRKNSLEEKHALEEKIETLKMAIAEKEKRLQEILLKTLALKNLIKRNTEIQLKENHIIEFPFIALEIISDYLNENSIEILSNKQKNFVKILCREPFQIYGDIDILLKMAIFKSDKRRIEELFSKELHQYFPLEFFFGEKKVGENIFYKTKPVCFI